MFFNYQIVGFGNKDERVSFSKHLDSLALKSKGHGQNIDVLIDSDLTFTSHVKAITKTAFYRLTNISRIKVLVSLVKHIHAFIPSRVDYCNRVFNLTSQKDH